MGDEDFDSIGEVLDDVPDDFGDETPKASEPADAAEAAEAADPPEAEAKPPAEPELGSSEESPFELNDLPEDQFVRLRIAGEESVVSLRELASGYTRHQTFSRKVNEATEATKRANAVAEQSRGEIARFQQGLVAMFSDPQKLDQFMTERYPDEWEAAASLAAKRIVAERELPMEKRMRIIRDRERARYERGAKQQLEAHRRAVAQEQYRQQVAQKSELFKAPWSEAMAEYETEGVDPETFRGVAQAAARMIDAMGSDDPGEIADCIRAAARRAGLSPRGSSAPAKKGAAVKAARGAPTKSRSRRGKAELRVDEDGAWDFSHLVD